MPRPVLGPPTAVGMVVAPVPGEDDVPLARLFDILTPPSLSRFAGLAPSGSQTPNNCLRRKILGEGQVPRPPGSWPQPPRTRSPPTRKRPGASVVDVVTA